ncbi:hypothetical protein M433DRAFT_158082 [Acidomyces richmondensis BFW]|nr:MAG: hypothetical protein FE78DRAFT_84957 [Acidomyces sp. 'richmondensis']KYG42271.1 hypothetical protein M433DRAFT_158082 [Acidomyces richmondensis BFW]
MLSLRKLRVSYVSIKLVTGLVESSQSMDDNDAGRPLVIQVWRMVSRSVTIVVLRVYARATRLKRITYDDYLQGSGIGANF